MTKGTKRYQDRIESELTRLRAIAARARDVEGMRKIVDKAFNRSESISAALSRWIVEGK